MGGGSLNQTHTLHNLSGARKKQLQGSKLIVNYDAVWSVLGRLIRCCHKASEHETTTPNYWAKSSYGCGLWIIWFTKYNACENYGFSLFVQTPPQVQSHMQIYFLTSMPADKCMLCSRPLGTTDENGWRVAMKCDKILIARLQHCKCDFPCAFEQPQMPYSQSLVLCCVPAFPYFFQTIGLYPTRKTICLITHWLSSPLIYILSYFNYAIHCILNVDKLLKIQRL